MKRLAIAIGLMALAGFLLLLGTRPSGLPSNIFPAHVQDLSNGELLFHAGGCASCHSSADADSELPVLGGGLAMETPFGTFRV
ncbi:MAG: hypothetical protein OES90_09320, partial [Xanthomonadales bacterium]|nr:hypothetical protein [Xanthomonadales bacterium]